jgi:hypothetical protein
VQRRVVSEWVRRSGDAVLASPSTASARRVKATLTSCGRGIVSQCELETTPKKRSPPRRKRDHDST